MNIVQINLIKGICLFFMCWVVQSTFSQSTYTLVGEVRDSIGLPIEIGNVYIYKASDSTLITGTDIINGSFKSPPLSEPRIYIKIASFDYNDFYRNFENDEGLDTVSAGVLILAPAVIIEGVEVVAQIPLFKIDGTTTTVNVEKTMLSASISPLEILKKSPGVLVDGGSVSVMGRGNADIFHNGQKITVDQLNNIPVYQIVKFVIIKNPTSRYDSDAAAVILVITKSYYQEGTSFIIRQSFTYPPFMSNTGLGMNYKGKKLSLNLNYEFMTGSTWNRRKQLTERTGLYSGNSEIYEKAKITGNIYSAGMTYDFDSTQKMTLGYSGLYNKNAILVNSGNLLTSSNSTLYQVLNDGDIVMANNSFIGNYRKILDTLGSNIFAGVQYTLSDFDFKDDISEDITIDGIFQGTANRRINSDHGVGIFAAQTDFEKYFSERVRLMGGLKYSSARTSGNFELDNFVQNEWLRDNLFSSTTKFDEEIYAAYTEFGLSLKSIEISAGLRYEYTSARGVTTQQNQLSLNRKYQWILPSFSLTKAFNEKIKFVLSYTTSTERPSYNSLDPKVYYVDSLTSKQGNPLLVPQVDHNITALFNLGPLTLDFIYCRSFNEFKDVVREGVAGPNSITLYKENFNADRYYASITVPFSKKWFNSYIYYTVGWDKVRGNAANFTQFKLTPTHYVYLYSSFEIKNLFNFELIGYYNSGRFDGIYKDRSTYELSLGLSREFLNKKLKCQLLFNDVFHTWRSAGTFYVDGYSVNYLSKASTQFLRLSVSTKLGRLRRPSEEPVQVGSKEGERIK